MTPSKSPSATPRRAVDVDASGTSTRRDAERAVLAEIEGWRASAMPDATAPLDADDLVRLLRALIDALRLDAAVVADFSVNTVHYYRRKDIIDPPVGRTAAARYDIRHVWQIAGARLAGALSLVTLAEARAALRGAPTSALLAFLAARVVDARARAAVRASPPTPRTDARALPGRAAAVTSVSSSPSSAPATMIPLPGNAWCVVPASHAAHRSDDAAAELARALVTALRGHRTR
jgi:hypothetical protein